MPDDNPYAVTSSSLESPGPVAADPEIEVRKQHRCSHFLAPLKALLLFSSFVAIVELGRREFGLQAALVISLSYVAVCIHLFFRSEERRITRWLLAAHDLPTCARGTRLVSLAFDKSRANRPQKRGLHRFAPPDHMGLLILDGGQLRFLGDAVTLSVPLEDVSGIEPARFFGAPGYTRVVLSRALSGHATFVLGNGQNWPPTQIFRGYRELRNDLRGVVDQKAPDED
jgi:hypothetical protein